MGLRTVETPEELAFVFAWAENAVGEYFGERTDDPAKGLIEIAGERYVLVRGGALSVEFFALMKGLFGGERKGEAAEFARNILYDLAYAIGGADARNFRATTNLDDPVKLLSAGPVHFTHCGWAAVHILEGSRPSVDDEFFLLYDHPHSFEADAWLRRGGRAGFPVCVMNAGYSAGWCEQSIGIRLVATEILCRAKGDEHCRFIMAPPGRIEEHIERFRRENPDLAEAVRSYPTPGLFVRGPGEGDQRRHAGHERPIFQALGEALVIVDEDGIILEANPAACALYGYSREEMAERTYKDLVRPEHHHLVEGLRQEVEAVGAGQIEAVGLRRDGAAIDLEIRGSPLTGGGRQRLLAVLRDVTGRRQAEETLREDLEKYRRLFTNLSDAALVVDAKTGIILEANLQAERLVGRRRDEIIGMRQTDLHPPEQADQHGRQLGASAETGRTATCRGVVVRQDGTAVPVQMSASPLTVGGRRIVLLVLQDITEHTQAEEQLAVFRQFAEVSGQGCRIARLDRTITYANPALCRLLGATGPSDVVGRSLVSFYAEDVRQHVDEEVLPAVIDEGEWTEELALISAEGKRIPIIENHFLIRDKNGLPQFLAAVITDITSRRQVQKGPKDTVAELEQSPLTTAGWEQQIAALKHEMNEMAARAGLRPPYDLTFARAGAESAGDDSG